MSSETILQQLKASIDTRINDLLCQTKPGYDDSVVGINEAWDVVRKAFDEYIAREAAGEIARLEAEIATWHRYSYELGELSHQLGKWIAAAREDAESRKNSRTADGAFAIYLRMLDEPYSG